MITADKHLCHDQSRNKKNFDGRLRRTADSLSHENLVIVDITLAEQPQNQAPVATGPISVARVDMHTVVVKHSDNCVKKKSRNCVEKTTNSLTNPTLKAAHRVDNHFRILETSACRQSRTLASQGSTIKEGDTGSTSASFDATFDYSSTTLHDVKYSFL